MRLYHDSTQYIERIDLSKSRPFKDFGQGFYLSAEENQAKELAKYKSEMSGESPCVTAFEFDEEGLLNTSLKMRIFEDYTEEWVDFIIANRDGLTTETYDYVYGPIADDKVGFQLRRYHDGTIDKESLIKNLKYAKGITFQYFFGSQEALKYLNRL